MTILLAAYLGAFAAGTVAGSFLNVLVYRLPSIQIAGIRTGAMHKLSYLAWPLSFCPYCATPIKPWLNIPILSYVLLGGKSRCCQRRLSIRYPVLEALGGAVAVACLLRFGFTLQCAAACALCWALLAAGWIDAQRYVLPDVLTLPLLWAGLLLNVSGTFAPLEHAVLGAAAGFVVLFAVSEGSELVLGKRMIGPADAKLLAAIGAWLGWQQIPTVLFVAAATAAVCGTAAHLYRRSMRRGALVAFGPHLAAGAALALLFGDTLTGWYWR